MAISREVKNRLVADYVERLSRSKALILINYRGLKVAELTQLRRGVQELDADFHVVKNTLIRLALEQSGLPIPEESFQGPTAVSFCYSEATSVAKVISNFAKEHRALVIKGGMLGTQIVEAKDMAALADLPPREVLLGQVLAGMQAPISGLVNVLAGPLRGLCNVLQARSRQLEEAGA